MPQPPRSPASLVRNLTWFAIAIAILIAITAVVWMITPAPPPDAGTTGHEGAAGLEEEAGGFDPVPQFEKVQRELEFRGADCPGDDTGPYRLYRDCR
jgi:hypothetical protein